ncbi:cytochrome c nitrite reductase pentaheme subunit [bacterium BMS3Abin04]|nr:cytochrome c nitrite reductase pentaheme subunit [bacterium BMS3Abin04]
MKKLFFLLSIFLLLLSTVFYAQEKTIQDKNGQNECLNCHKSDENLPDDFKSYDVHITAGLTCADCHGGDPTSDDEDIAMSKKNGFVGVPSRKDIPQFCGRCHSDFKFMKNYRPEVETDQVKQYYTSIHGIQLKKGDKNVAVCTSCHTAHSILPPKDPRSSVYALNVPATCNKCHGDKKLMDKYNLPSDIYKKYVNSVHGIDLLKNKDVTGAPACNDCHGNHGATPPGVSSIVNVCGTCHVNNYNYFKASKMGKDWEGDNDYHGCVTCHNNHDIKKPNDSFVGVGDDALCSDCHDKGDKGYEEAKKIHQELTNLSTLYDSAKVKLIKVKQLGMDDISIGFMLKDAHQAMIKARTTVHTFSSAKVAELTVPGIKIANNAIKKADEEISDYHTRRYGLGAATIAILILIIGLYLKLKGLNKPEA